MSEINGKIGNFAGTSGFITGDLFSVRLVIYPELWSKGRNFENGKVFKIKE
jgi:hypothetical protein